MKAMSARSLAVRARRLLRRRRRPPTPSGKRSTPGIPNPLGASAPIVAPESAARAGVPKAAARTATPALASKASAETMNGGIDDLLRALKGSDRLGLSLYGFVKQTSRRSRGSRIQESALHSPCPEKGAPGQRNKDQVCAQLHLPGPDLREVRAELDDLALGIPPSEAQIALQQDCVKELMNKLAWVLGSVYRVNYSNMRTPARRLAWRIAKKVIEDQGYPSKIGK